MGKDLLVGAVADRSRERAGVRRQPARERPGWRRPVAFSGALGKAGARAVAGADGDREWETGGELGRGRVDQLVALGLIVGLFVEFKFYFFKY